jgi:hypothetical protein
MRVGNVRAPFRVHANRRENATIAATERYERAVDLSADGHIEQL